jgi:hypothetical protein
MKTLTEKEMFAQTVRALDRMQCKELACGNFVVPGVGICVARAYQLHQTNAGSIAGQLWKAGYGDSRWNGTLIGTGATLENDGFMRGDNSPEARKSRWKHMRAWAEERAQ